jgi:membrane protein YfhO
MLPRVTRALRRLRGTAALAAALYAVLALAFVSPALLPGKTLAAPDYLWSSAPWKAEKPDSVRFLGSNYELADTAVQLLPYMQYTRERLPEVPLWNPHIMLGRPYVGNGQSAVFSPFNAPAYVLPFWRSLALIAALKLFVAAFGTFLLAGALGMRFGGAFVAGCVFAFSLFVVAFVAYPIGSALVLIPWVLWATERLVQRPGALTVVPLALTVGVQFLCGHPQTSFHTLVAALLLLAWRLWERRRDGPSRAVITGGVWIGAVALGAVVAAVALAPFVEMLIQSETVSRGGARLPTTVPPRNLLTIFLTDYWGRPTQSPIGGFTVTHAFYAGALPLFLAVVALIVRPTRGRLAALAGAALALAIVVGRPGRLLHAVNDLPGFGQVYNTRLIVFFLLVMALLAGWGLHDLASQPNRRRLRIALAVCFAMTMLPVLVVLVTTTVSGDLVTGLAIAWGLDDMPPAGLGVDNGPLTRLVAVVAWGMLAAAALVLLVLLVRRGQARWVLALVSALVIVDLFRAGMGWNPATGIDVARPPTTPAIEHLRGQGPARFSGVTPAGGDVPLTPDSAMYFGLYDARGYDVPWERHYERFWKRYVAALSPTRDLTTVSAVHEPALRALGLVGTTRLVQDPDDPPLHLPGLRLAYSGPDARLYANSRALPRAWVVPSQRVVEGSEQRLRAVGSSSFEPRREAVVERPVPGLGGGSGGSATITRYEPEHVEIAARSRGAGLLVLSDLFYPGWKARVDGEEVDIEEVDYLLRGVPLASGAHRVEFVYEPLSWRIGWILSLVGLAALCLLTVVGLRRRSRCRA